MNDLEQDWGALVERYAASVLPPGTWMDRFLNAVAFTLPSLLVGALLSQLIFGNGSLATPIGWVPVLVVAGVGGVVTIRINRRLVDGRRALIAGGPTPHLARIVIDGVRGDVERQRGRTLGSESEWGRTRSSLDEAHAQAASSVAYWAERNAAEPESEIAKESLGVARELEEKFAKALSELDSQVTSLRGFFDACDARLSRMESFGRDLEETEKLRSLSDEAESLVADARELVGGIASEFLLDAIRVSSVLASFENVRVLKKAGEQPIEQLEEVAQELIETAERQQELIGTLLGQVDQTA